MTKIDKIPVDDITVYTFVVDKDSTHEKLVNAMKNVLEEEVEHGDIEEKY